MISEVDQSRHSDGGPDNRRWAAGPRAEAKVVPTSEPIWPAFGSEDIGWDQVDDAYGPRRGASAYRGPYRAAVPAEIAGCMPALPPSTVALVDEATAEIARFDGESLGSTTSFAALLLRTEAASSSQIEDLTSSPKAIALAELGRKGRSNADQIVANVTAMTEALEVAGHLDTEAILRMHRALMIDQMAHRAGVLRTEPVWIGGSHRGPHDADYVAPCHGRIPAAMDDLSAFLARGNLPVLTQAAVAHAQFENLHPFPDGNGRTGRALLHAMLRSGGLVTRSVVPISAGLLAATGSYFSALEAYRGGDPVQIVAGVAEAVFPALANSRRMINEITVARESWEDTVKARRGAAAWRLADLLITRPVVSSSLVAAQLGVTAANAQLAIDRLVDDGVLSQIGRGQRDRVWQATEVIDAMEGFAARVRRR